MSPPVSTDPTISDNVSVASSIPIFVNIHLRVTHLRTRNGASVMMIPVILVKRKLLSTYNFKKWALEGGIFSLTCLQYFKLFLPLLFSPFPYSFYGFLSLCGTLNTYLPLVLVYLVPPVLLSVSITTPFTSTLLIGLSSMTFYLP